jgi:hypothetical protein
VVTRRAVAPIEKLPRGVDPSRCGSVLVPHDRRLRELFDQLHNLTDPEERTFHEELPDLIVIWRGCERGRERGLHWTMKREVAEGFAQGKRCINASPTLVSAMISRPKQLSRRQNSLRYLSGSREAANTKV